MTDIHAKISHLSQSAQKVRIVIDMVRGKSANEALEILRFVNKRAALPVQKLVASAVANAEENFGVSRDDLFVAKITADEALKKIEEGKFDFGIFDVNMPGKTGIELVPLVLNHPNGKSMKIVILTTESSAEIRKKGEDAGASAWMVKPFKNAEMIDLLKQLE